MKSFLISSMEIEHDAVHPAFMRSLPHVAILLTTYNGAVFLKEQLQSIVSQTYPHWTLYISDDGSTDDTLNIIDNCRKTLGPTRVHLFSGPRKGFAQNFLSLVRNPNVSGDYFAFCDQDDIWHPDKLERGLAALSGYEEAPALYCSRTRLVEEEGGFIGYSPLFQRKPSFQNALVQSLAGANTMLLNRRAQELLKKIPPTASVVSHDWLCYMLVSGCGGQVVFDTKPTLDYRQHRKNLMGRNNSWRGRIARAGMMFNGTFRRWNHSNIAALQHCADQLDEHNRYTLGLFEAARNAKLLRRLFLLRKAGVYRQSSVGTLCLMIAAALGKV